MEHLHRQLKLDDRNFDDCHGSRNRACYRNGNGSLKVTYGCKDGMYAHVVTSHKGDYRFARCEASHLRVGTMHRLLVIYDRIQYVHRPSRRCSSS
jgi:hypothetical protein